MNNQDSALINVAEQIAVAAHAGQVGKNSAPYIEHPRTLVALVKAWEGDATTQAIAWLHDVLEDTPVTVADLEQAGIPDVVIQGVVTLTRQRDSQGQDESYLDSYIPRVKQASAQVQMVKRADLTHHLQRKATLPTNLEQRYRQALAILEAS